MTAKPKLRFLYLEADAESRKTVTTMLGRSNIEVIVAKTADEAWRLAMNQNFDLYLLDGLLPGGDSLDLCQNLREQTPNTPILFYSELAFQADIQEGLGAGADAYLVKPYDRDLSETVLDTVRNGRTVSSFTDQSSQF